MDNLDTLRKQIDTTDKEIFALIKKRAQLAHDVGEVKRANQDNSFYRPEREAEVLRNIAKNNDSLLRDKDIAYIFRQIMSACLALEMPMKIGYLGPIGTWSGDATIKHFGDGVEAVPKMSIDEVFNGVEKNDTKYGVVPIENSTNGTVTLTVSNLFQHNLKICGEVEIRINHQLLAKSSDIKTIAAHSQALDQCHKFLSANYENVELRPVNSNAVAAEMAVKNQGVAAIASKNAAKIYDLDIIASNIEDNPSNTTRFLVLGKEDIAPSGDDKTTILITAKDKSGVLFDLLSPFKELGINLLKLDSYPDPQNNWQYLFLIDIDGHIADNNMQQALALIKKEASSVKFLGSYPKRVL
jgi:chorismate mutase/prephenate dehydratase